MPDASLGEKLKNWRLLAEGLKTRLEEIPFIKEDHVRLRTAATLAGAAIVAGVTVYANVQDAVRYWA